MGFRPNVKSTLRLHDAIPLIQSRYDNTPFRSSFELPPIDVPTSARVLIIGGGIAGMSVAYHFAKAGWSDVYLLEQNQIASGTTWHSAGQVGQLRSNSAQTKVNKASAALYARLRDETGHDPGWLQCGGLQLATCAERMHQLHRNASLADVFGVEAEVITARECGDYWPMLNADDVVGAVYLPGDGRVLPGETTIALAKGALQGGGNIIAGITVESLLYQESPTGFKRFTGVDTNRGEIACEWIVLAGNMWMRQLGMTAGVDIPVYPCEHHYLITRPIDGVTRDCPCTRDPDAGIYFRALDDGGLILGAFKKRSEPWRIHDHVPNDFAFQLLDPDWPDFEQPFANHRHRLRGINRDDVVRFINGPEAFTPDNNFILGTPYCTAGLFICGGWNSAGIACAGGAGRFAVEWIENDGMTVDLTSVDILRFLPFQNNRTYLQQRVSEVLGLHYGMAWPGRQMETSRNVRVSELYEIHRRNNACFGETAGWERPLFYAPRGVEPHIDYSFVRQNWHQWVGDEVRACRENVAILDQSSFAKFTLAGPEALAILQKLCTANVDRAVDRVIYTAMLNRQGTFESDLTVVRTAKDALYLVSATSQQLKDFDWISRHIGDGREELTDVTEQFNVVSVMGPKAPDVLSQLSPTAFPLKPVNYGIARNVMIGGIPVRALRISYVGELGWELHVPVTHTRLLYDNIMQCGSRFGIRPIGSYAISTMRIEKGFRAIGHELSPEETPLHAGLAWTIDWGYDFIGRDALQKLKQKGVKKRLACFLVQDHDLILWGSEPIFWNGEIAGYTTSAGYSPTLAGSVALGYVRNPSGGLISGSDLTENNFEIEHNGKRYPAKASWKAFL